MRTESAFQVILRLLGKISLVELALFIITAAICWLGGWRTRTYFGTGLMIAGMIAVVAGGISAFGGSQIAKDPTYRYIQSVMSNSLSDRTKQDWQDNLESMSFMIWAGIAGFIAAGAGYLIITVGN